MSQTKKVFEFGQDINGQGKVIYKWSQDNSFIAVCGESKNLYVLDKRGRKLKEINIQAKSKVIQLEWDRENEYICILYEDFAYVSLWNVFGNSQLSQIETDNSKSKASFIKWSRTHPVLAIGTDKGSLIFYNKKNSKKIPTIGKHTKKIVTGDWNLDGLLVTGSEDKTITVSTYNSETAYDSVSVKLEPRNIKWARPKTDERETVQKTITAVLSQKSLLMFELGSKKTPLELVFEQKYGKIIDYRLFGDGYIVVGFSEGNVAHISTHMKEMTDEISSERIFQSTLDALTTNDQVYKLAVAGEDQIKIYNLATWKEIKHERIELPKSAGKVTKMSWSNNGQILIVTTTNGYLYGFQTSIPFVTSTFQNFSGMLTSFTEITLMDTTRQPQNNILTTITLENEPSFISLGPYHIAAGINNMVWYYQWLDSKKNGLIMQGELVLKRDYLGSVKSVQINDLWAAVLADNKCTLHPIDPKQMSQEVKEIKFPTNETDKPICQIALTKDFLIYLDTGGKLKYYNIADQQVIIDFSTQQTISRFYNNFFGTRAICIDNKGNSYYFEASSQFFQQIPRFPQKTDLVLWDSEDLNQFAVLESDQMLTFRISKNNIFGTLIEPVNEILSIEQINKSTTPIITILDRGVKPISLQNGFLKCYTQQGLINGQNLGSHSYLNQYKEEQDDKEGHFRYFMQNLSLQKFNNSLKAAKYLNNQALYDILGRKALEYLELDLALKAFQLSKSLSMVLTIKSFNNENEKNVICGNVAMILGEYDKAEDFYYKSTRPLNALDMRCDIQDYMRALNLAKQIAPEQEPYVCRRLAAQIESQGNNSEARKLYEKAVINIDNKEVQKSEKVKIDEHNLLCFSGISKTSIKLGDVNRGFNIAKELNDNNIVLDIAQVCENLKQYQEAAELYEKIGMMEKAAMLFIQKKQFKQVQKLITQIKSPKILSSYAKSLESEGGYKEAEKIYEKAEDWENVVRLNLSTQIDNFDKAMSIVRTKCPTSTCANMVATVCDKRGLKKEQVEFYILAGKKEEAFTIAQTNNEMDWYVECMKTFSIEERLRIAQYYEGTGLWIQASSHYEKANNQIKALKLLFQAGLDYIEQMIDMVAQNSTQEALVQLFIDYLTGDYDNVPKDPKYLLKFYLKTGNVAPTISVALTIAQDEMEHGNYKQVHQLLFETIQKFKEKQLPIPLVLEQKLSIVHAYTLIKRVAKIDDHDTAALLLNRICLNISQFQSHSVNILTSAVIEAMKSNKKYLAYKWSVELVRPETRSQIKEQYKSRIENIARKPVKEEVDDSKSQCPYCKELVPDYEFDCKNCQNYIPFCIASGKHIVAGQVTWCNSCKFPANINYLKKLLAPDKTCPLCNVELDPDNLQEIGEEGIKQLKQQRMKQKDGKQTESPSTQIQTKQQ